jgi:antitoxin component YwqK of YwqJK toxin-antitoxin module
VNYTAGLLDGSWKQFYENDKLQIKGKYLDGKKVGV